MTHYDIDRMRGENALLLNALWRIAAFDDEGANSHLANTGNFECFDEPAAAALARETIAQVREQPAEALRRQVAIGTLRAVLCLLAPGSEASRRVQALLDDNLAAAPAPPSPDDERAAARAWRQATQVVIDLRDAMQRVLNGEEPGNTGELNSKLIRAAADQRHAMRAYDACIAAMERAP